MATAHGKITDKLEVCLSISGPGATNLITGWMLLQIEVLYQHLLDKYKRFTLEVNRALKEAFKSEKLANIDSVIDPGKMAASTKGG